MKKSFYSSPDSFVSAYLVFRKFRPELIDEGGKIIFSFEASDDLYGALDDYAAGAEVPASQFSQLVKGLKSRIFSMKKGNGNGYGQTARANHQGYNR